MENCRGITLMPLLYIISFLAGPLGHPLYVTITWYMSLDYRHPFLLWGMLEWSNKFWGPHILVLYYWWATSTTVTHSELSIIILMTLSSIDHNKILNESLIYWYSFRCPTKPPPILHPWTLLPLPIYLVPKLPACVLFFTDLWDPLKTSMVGNFPLE